MDEARYEAVKDCLKQVFKNKTDKNAKIFLDDFSINPIIMSALGRAYDTGFADAVKKQLEFPNDGMATQKEGVGTERDFAVNNVSTGKRIINKNTANR